jgi:hypothetical protein
MQKTATSALAFVQYFVKNAGYKESTTANAKPLVPIQSSQTVINSAMISSMELAIATTATPLLLFHPNHQHQVLLAVV